MTLPQFLQKEREELVDDFLNCDNEKDCLRAVELHDERLLAWVREMLNETRWPVKGNENDHYTNNAEVANHLLTYIIRQLDDSALLTTNQTEK